MSTQIVYRPLLLVTEIAELGTLAAVDLTPRYAWVQVPYMETP